MTKQEEIREAITYCPEGKECPHYGSKNWQDCIDCMVENVMNTLHSQGCVFRVEGKLPSIFNSNEDVISALEYRKKLVGYVPVEPLVKEKE